MIIKKEFGCEQCNTIRLFKYSTTTNKIYDYRAICKKCMLTNRNKSQNFSKRKYTVTYNFNIIDSEVKAYLFGFLWADSHLSIRNRANSTPLKSLNLIIHPKDEEIAKLCVENIGGSYRIKSYFRKDLNRDQDRLEWSINSKILCDNLLKLNFKKNTDSIPDDLYHHFLRGLFDGDGCFYKRKNCNSIEAFISSHINQDWSFISSRISLPYRTFKKEYKEKSSVFYFLGSKKDLVKYLYKDAVTFLQRKYDIVKHLTV